MENPKGRRLFGFLVLAVMLAAAGFPVFAQEAAEEQPVAEEEKAPLPVLMFW